ncbi:MAG: hypothetical protein H2060_01845 [Azoarcus sp.]|nr:hypothetical protein [Azoarcus sp.]
MNKPNFLECSFFVLALLAALFIQGAVPFLAIPTMGQAVWATGFSHSFANGGLFEIYAHNIGAPEPAPIAFGLAGAWPASLFIRLGLHAADAYSAMVAFWLSVAFGSAYGIARHFQAARYHSTIAALCWMTMPVIWAHGGYSMLSLGIGLLSFYFLVVIKLLDGLRNDLNITAWTLLYVLSCIISVFMDGYSFMMFAVGSSIMIGLQWMRCKDFEVRRRWSLMLIPVHVAAFVVAYLLYSSYIGLSSFDSHSMEFFRGWGVDLSFIAIPTHGSHWLADIVGWSAPRTDNMYWGDASVWTTTFSLPLILAAAWAARKSHPQRNWVVAFCVASLFGFYMALGPSLKFNTIKPPEASEERVMNKVHAIAPTGSALLSENIPGFNVMRASYRWIALGAFCAWLILVLSLSYKNKRPVTLVALAMTLIVTAFNLPNSVDKWKIYSDHRSMFLEVDRAVLAPLSKDLIAGERVAFLPWGNDFLVNYLASEAGVIAYNIGGDKNLNMAREHWPSPVRSFPMATVDNVFFDRLLLLLYSNEVNVVVLPFFDTLWAAHSWPHPNVALHEQLRPVIERLKLVDFVRVTERENYATVRVDMTSVRSDQDNPKAAIQSMTCLPPRCLRATAFSDLTPSGTGQPINGALHSTGREGFMLFGPYQPMNAGTYSLVVRGEVETADGSWIDVASNSGQVIHGKWDMSGAGAGAEVLLSTTVEITGAVRDLEVRVYARAPDQITINSYELRPVPPESGPQ